MSKADEFKSRMIAQLKAKVRLYMEFEAELPPSFKDFARGYIIGFAESESLHTSLFDFESIFKEVLEEANKV